MVPICTLPLLQSTTKPPKELEIRLCVAEALIMRSYSSITGQITLQIKRDSR